jgi:hypothetical protein
MYHTATFVSKVFNFIGGLLIFTSILVLFIAIFGVGEILEYDQSSVSWILSFLVGANGVFSAIGLFFSGVVYYSFGQVVVLLRDIAINTRETNRLLSRSTRN